MYGMTSISETHIRKIFHKMFGMAPKRNVFISRSNPAAGLLIADPLLQVLEAAEAAGYSDLFHFSTVFK